MPYRIAGIDVHRPRQSAVVEPYANVGNNPTALIDPLGLDPCVSPLVPSCVINVIGHIGGVLGGGGSDGAGVGLSLLFRPGAHPRSGTPAIVGFPP